MEQKLAVTTDCAGPGKQVRTELVLCHASSTYAGSDYAGAYQAVPLGLPCPPTNGCVAPNPYTGSCACPAGSEPLAFAMDLPVCGGASFVDGVLVMCWKPDADKSTFDGAHLVNDLAPFCPFPHPQTATCECPDAAGAYGMRLLRKEQGVLIGAVMYLCRPGETP